jgi:uncharacterized protein YgfB (UPF0149 family)
MEINFTRPDGVEFFDKSEAYFEWVDGAITGFNLSDPTGKQQVAVGHRSNRRLAKAIL